jgi:hypothetical protein
MSTRISVVIAPFPVSQLSTRKSDSARFAYPNGDTKHSESEILYYIENVVHNRLSLCVSTYKLGWESVPDVLCASENRPTRLEMTGSCGVM